MDFVNYRVVSRVVILGRDGIVMNFFFFFFFFSNFASTISGISLIPFGKRHPSYLFGSM